MNGTVGLQRIHRRLVKAASGDSGIALLMSLFVMLMVSTLSIGLLATVLNETKPTQLERKRTQTINGAEAGLQATLNQLRSANDGAGKGVLSKLPCTSGAATFTFSNGSTKTADGATFGGSVGPASGNATYTAYVAYYASDPSPWYADSTQWANFASSGSGAKAMSCPLTQVPAYAFVQSVSRGSTVSGLASTVGNRAVHGTYQFSTTNVNLVGGRLREYGAQLCLEAGSAGVVQAGQSLYFQPCQAIGYPFQMWSYRTDLSIQYQGNAALNLCISSTASLTATPTLQTCVNQTVDSTTSTYPYDPGQQVQEWGFNDSGHLASVSSTGDLTSTTSPPGFCLEPFGASDSVQAASGAQLVVANCDGSTTGYSAWDPDAQVGAGMAGTVTTGVPGAPTYQLVNYSEFGRCLDVTGQNPGNNYLIAYPCKQAPDPLKLTWNQVWTFSSSPGGTGTFSSRYTKGPAPDNLLHCLTSSSTNNSVVTAPVCDGSASQKWTATGKITGNYTGSYEVVNSAGLCMTSLPKSSLPSFAINTTKYSTIIVQTCDGTLKQKWNAPYNDQINNVSNLNEDSGLK